ncbi:hypothetical protein DL546_001432 [Coniochaeta pulveracea]|uniref:Uncharacterized protein n=1 Tax=Coniochaeta pulveracea TaxID=177199 RepID=A0A420XXE3_9PEZI|nr:hypothetical protein DL546_001432 [Coniochaeta pulveracea]
MEEANDRSKYSKEVIVSRALGLLAQDHVHGRGRHQIQGTEMKGGSRLGTYPRPVRWPFSMTPDSKSPGDEHQNVTMYMLQCHGRPATSEMTLSAIMAQESAVSAQT